MKLQLVVVLLVVGCGSAPARRPPPASMAQPPSASAKAMHRPPAVKPPVDKAASEPVLDASLLLVREDLEATLKRTTLPAYEAGRLQDEPASAMYDSWHFKAIGQPESHDLAFRIWRLPADELDQKWTEIKAGLPNVVDAAPIGGARAFNAREPGDRIFGHAFHDKPRHVIVLVTCGTDLCKTADEARAFATLIHGRLGRLR